MRRNPHVFVRSMTESTPPRPSLSGPFFLTFAAILLIAALAILPFWAGKPDEAGLQGIARFIGRFHPVVLHLPIGMLVWVLLLETGNLFSRKPGLPSSRTPMMFTAFSAVIAALLGFVLYYSRPDYDAALVERHLYGGLFFACAAVATFAFKTWVDTFDGRGAVLYRILLLGCAGVMVFTSHDGASLTHGKGYLTDHAPDSLRKLLGMPVKQARQPALALKDASEQIAYTDLIVPILEQKCYSCHNEEKRKGRYRMDEYELLLAGGKEGDGIVPGNSAQSNMIVRIELPEDDEEHMPPEGKKDLEEHEIALLKWWIDNGASKDAKMADLPVTDEVKAAIAKMIPPQVIEQQKAAEENARKKESARRDSIMAELVRLQAKYPAAINFESQDSARLAFTAVGMRKTFGDADLAKLEAVIPTLVSLDLSATSVTDSGARLLANAVELKSLRLSETEVTDAALDFLAELPNLESLNLHSTGIGNGAVPKLASMTQLRKLYLWRTGVDAEGLRKLGESLPDCEIVTGT
jgi:uncharacterized membrane protein